MHSLKMGEILVAKETNQNNNGIPIKKENMAIVGFDKRIHDYSGNQHNVNKEDIEFNGYCASGLASYICEKLKNKIPLDKILEDYNISEIDLIEDIAFILVGIGMEE